MTQDIRIQGPCDVPGCPNEAVVHYGLEEFYCRECHEKSHVQHLRLKREYQEYLDDEDCSKHLIQPEDRPS